MVPSPLSGGRGLQVNRCPNFLFCLQHLCCDKGCRTGHFPRPDVPPIMATTYTPELQEQPDNTAQGRLTTFSRDTQPAGGTSRQDPRVFCAQGLSSDRTSPHC